MFALLCDWTSLLPLRKTFSIFLFQLLRLLKRMSCIVLDFEIADINLTKELGVFMDGKFQGYSFRPTKMGKPTKQSFWCTRILYGIAWNKECLNYSEISDILPRDVKGE